VTGESWNPTRRAIVSAPLVAMAGAALVACGRQASPVDAPVLGPATLRWTSWATAGDALQRATDQANAFMAAFPTVKVELDNVASGATYRQKLITQTAAGSPSDVFRTHIHDYESWITQGIVAALDGRIKQEPKDSYFTRINPAIWDIAHFKGKVYGLPNAGMIPVVWVNKPLFQEAGLPLPPAKWGDPGWTWDTYLQAATRLTKRSAEGPLQVGTGVPEWKFHWWTFIYANGGEVLNKERTELMLHTPQALEALQFVADWRAKHRVAATPDENKGGTFDWKNGKLGMNPGDLGIAGTATFSHDVYPFPMPSKAAGKPAVFWEHTYWSMSTGSKVPNAAWAYLKWLGGPDGSRIENEYGFSLTFIKGTEDAYLKRFPALTAKVPLSALDYVVRANPYHAGWYEMMDVLQPQLDALLSGQKTAKEAITAAKPPIDALLKQAR
jgi:multiple sugar transport system substrate-binding protein